MRHYLKLVWDQGLIIDYYLFNLNSQLIDVHRTTWHLYQETFTGVYFHFKNNLNLLNFTK
uniref:Uncharacterized protein n=1 Tax=Anguilla anguilla TaxID=7936 RepID=A0A0E9X630_ANGAN